MFKMHPLVYPGKQVSMFPVPFSWQLAVHFSKFTLSNLSLLQHGLFTQRKKNDTKNRKLI